MSTHGFALPLPTQSTAVWTMNTHCDIVIALLPGCWLCISQMFVHAIALGEKKDGAGAEESVGRRGISVAHVFLQRPICDCLYFTQIRFYRVHIDN